MCVVFAVIFTGGCGGSNSNDDGGSSLELGGEAVKDFSGAYSVSARSTTKFAADGGACGSSRGSMKIENNRISGKLNDTWGYTYHISGDVATNGDVSGGFSISLENAAVFSGKMTGSSGSGVWEDIYECRGIWEAERQ